MVIIRKHSDPMRLGGENHRICDDVFNHVFILHATDATRTEQLLTQLQQN